MIHIAICDDNLSDTELIEKMLMGLQCRLSEKIETSIFYSGEDFCRAIRDSCPFDIVLMDIEMDGIDGIKAGQKLRQDDENDMVLLLYISSHENYYLPLFDVQPYGFIKKPISSEEFSTKLNKAIQKALDRRQDGKRKVLAVCQKGHELLIPFHKIVYLESKVRKVCLFATDGMIEYYSTLNDEEQKLSSIEFVRTHQSYIINFRHIKEISSESLTLADNTEIPISSNRRYYVRDRYMEYRRNFFE